jgi:hypothetical protein
MAKGSSGDPRPVVLNVPIQQQLDFVAVSSESKSYAQVALEITSQIFQMAMPSDFSWAIQALTRISESSG